MEGAEDLIIELVFAGSELMGEKRDRVGHRAVI